MEFHTEHTPKASTFIIIGVITFFIFTFIGSYFWTHQFKDRIAPNVSIGTIDVSGMTLDDARQTIEAEIDQLLVGGVTVEVNTEQKTLSLSTLVSSDFIENVEFDLEHALTKAQQAQRSSNPLLNIWTLIASNWNPVTVPVATTLSEENLKLSLYELFPEIEAPGQNAQFVFLQDANGWQVRTNEGINGTEFDWKSFFFDLSKNLSTFDHADITLNLIATSPEVSQEQAELQKDTALEKLMIAPITWTYTDERKEFTSWTLNREQIAKMILPSNEENVVIDQDAFNLFLDPIAEAVEHPAQNARLQVENERVTEFFESKAGTRLDREALFELISNETDSIHQLVFLTEEPAIQTGDVNDLGIDQILGSGTSSYRGSPSNRRKNIQNGVDLLNGLLIPPGETFSLVEALKPFDMENGYLPELVIKGTKITPELGGGLCQIGTTTFRAVMNSGLPVIERRNHSLVVSYYNDPSNKNPGTDATIYDPAPDFKFQNDTDHYVLFQAENLTATQELRFTFWGTTDGRKGSYTPPKVIRWIPVGETLKVETTDLKPGEEKCQEAHIGADATFDYSIVRPDGTIDLQTFDSHYRPLPRICLVGVEPTPEILEPVLPEQNGESTLETEVIIPIAPTPTP